MELSPEALQTVTRLVREIAGVRQERKIWSSTLQALAVHFGAASGGLFTYRRSADRLVKVRSVKEAEAWEGEELLEFFHNRKPGLDDTTIMAPVRAGRRIIGVLALGRERPFELGVGKEATEMLKIIGRWAGWRRDLAEQGAECAVAKAGLRGVAPKDLGYRILHQLRRFIDYDHGATVVAVAPDGTGTVVARQVAWGKGRSDLVGWTFPLAREDLPSGEAPVILVPGSGRLWDLLVPLRESTSPRKEAAMAARLAYDGRPYGLVELSSSRRDFFVDHDAGVLARFVPYLAWCLRSLGRATGGC